MKVKECMCNQVTYATPSTSVQDCATMMNNKHIGCIPICDNSQNVVGLITDRDITLRCVACNKNPKTTPVSEIMTCDVCCCDSEADMQEVERLMSENQVKRIPIIDNNKLVGILTLGDLVTNEQISNNSVSNTLNCICGSSKNNAQ